jgi:hypothetical protein
VFNYTLVAPSGDIITPSTPGIRYIAGNGVHYYRLNLPVVVNGRPNGAGPWRARLEVDRRRLREYAATLANDPKALEQLNTHGLRWAMEIHARSSLRMKVQIHQKGIDPGAVMHLSARLSEYGIPVEDRAKVRAELNGPGGQGMVELKETAPGLFEGSLEGKERGLYRFRVVAQGRTLRGVRFTREQTLTGAIYEPKPPEDPKPPEGGSTQPCRKILCALLAAIRQSPRLGAQVEASLRPSGVALAELLRCLDVSCRQP